jgi:hypothetical protein
MTIHSAMDVDWLRPVANLGPAVSLTFKQVLDRLRGGAAVCN